MNVVIPWLESASLEYALVFRFDFVFVLVAVALAAVLGYGARTGTATIRDAVFALGVALFGTCGEAFGCLVGFSLTTLGALPCAQEHLSASERRRNAGRALALLLGASACVLGIVSADVSDRPSAIASCGAALVLVFALPSARRLRHERVAAALSTVFVFAFVLRFGYVLVAHPGLVLLIVALGLPARFFGERAAWLDLALVLPRALASGSLFLLAVARESAAELLRPRRLPVFVSTLGLVLGLAIVLGWLYLRPGPATFLPGEVHGFGGLHPRLHTPGREQKR